MATKLYSGTRNASSWAMRAWLALKEAGVAFEEEVVDIRPPQRFANLARIGGFSPPAAVPVLVVDGETIFDSLAIMEYANELAGGRLLPAAPLDRARARSVLAWQHSGLSGICGLISFESAFYPDKRALTRRERAECDRLFAFLEGCLARSGGPYLFGELSLPDLALVPTVVRLTSHAPDFGRWPLTLAWTKALLSRPHVAWWMDEARKQPHVWYDVYLAVPADDA
ncbi:glutathione S-transferase family protein [Luteibacter yeojuensis]|uniref:Glutathione S-transferase family protein n=1 Tax=Luteibacter yeojuensis TaxID=345309 RepID=A0A7X5TQU9_9GAMM|nr:glutathione S-transferase family protein [Luteibacter yeojuensis]NID16204.1 glutathione S-transferase family protein [Luteibacter yeojuensis]